MLTLLYLVIVAGCAALSYYGLVALRDLGDWWEDRR